MKGKEFVIGGLGGCGATVVVQPMDVVKTQMQMSARVAGTRGVTLASVVGEIFANSGIRGFYKGLSAGLLRQSTYTTARMGLFSTYKSVMPTKADGTLAIQYKLLSGVLAGGTAAVIGTPSEVGLIRMMGDAKLPVHKRRNYKNVFDALFRVVKEEGALTLWRGCTPTVVRAMLLNGVQLGSYDQAKQILLGTPYFKDDVPLHFTASLISGFLATCVSMPSDMAKTRLQTMTEGEFSGPIDVLVKVAKQDGVLALWRGFWPYFFRLGPHTILTFLIMEKLRLLL